jgi:hypothetical protein
MASHTLSQCGSRDTASDMSNDMSGAVIFLTAVRWTRK